MILVLFLLASAAIAATPAEFFEMRVRPVLAKNCFGCHTQSKMGGLDLSSRDSLMKGGKRGAAVVPRDPDRSLLIAAIRQSGDVKMPPSGKLTGAEIADLTAWVRDGAEWPVLKVAPAAAGKKYEITAEQRQWWAFQPVRKPAPPAVRNRAVREPLDRFIHARLEGKGLEQAPPADRRALIRRAYYDLTGLPPNAAQVEAFEKDKSPEAFAKVVDELLKSPRYGERWGRYWLDIARYSDDKLNSTQDDPYPNAWRYRDWVIQAFNDDMPYDTFVKAQIAGDLLPDRDKLVAGLGFYALSPEFQDDRVDATSRGFMAVTTACAQCHDHKFDPIPQRDYYALLGVFTSSQTAEHPLAPPAVVKEFADRKKRVDDKQKEIEDFLEKQGYQLAEILAAQSARYLRAAREKSGEGLDKETFERWTKHLASEREHPYLKDWDKPGFDADAFQAALLAVITERKKIDETNLIRLGGSNARRDLASADLLSLPRDKYLLWRDLVSKERGILYFREKQIDRFLLGQWKLHAEGLRADLERFKKEMPAQYPFFHVMKDADKPRNARIRIRGAADNLGDEAPRAFLSILSKSEPRPFEKGSGRLELAEAVGSKENPLTPRVIANRLWQYHFGAPLVATPSNFGQLGEKPTHPELLDYLAARLIESGWSLKALHREIMLSRTWQASTRYSEKAFTADPENRLLWRAHRRRLDVEPLRDTLLAMTGELDLKAGGPPEKLTEAANVRRTVYGFVSRRKLDGTLALFDFPNPNSHSEQRIQTATPLQQLYFLNSTFVRERAKRLAEKFAGAGPDDTARIRSAYRTLFAREASPDEIKAGLAYLRGESAEPWQRYAQALLASNELVFLN